MPQAIISDKGIEDSSELSHGGDESDLGRFAGVVQAAIEDTESVVMANGIERGHVEGAADRGTATGDMPLAAELSAIVIDGCDPDQSGELLVLDTAEFGELGEKDGRGCRTDALDAGQNGLAVRQGMVGFDGRRDCGIDLRELVAQHDDMSVDPGGDGGAGVLEMVAFGIKASMSWRRRATKPANASREASIGGKGAGRIASPKLARTRASIQSVLASRP